MSMHQRSAQRSSNHCASFVVASWSSTSTFSSPWLKTKDAPRAFATGDRVQFVGSAATRECVAAGLFNGAVGTLEAIDGRRVTVRLDGPKDAPPRSVSFTVGPDAKAGEFDALRHGYAGTIYKGQGKTLNQSYVLHSDNWRSATSYVALSRHRDSVTLFAAEQPRLG